MLKLVEKVREKKGITPIKLEIIKLLTWSGTGSLAFGIFLLLFWAVFNLLEAGQKYLYFASPVITPRNLKIMIILAFISFSNFVLGVIARRAIIKDRKWARFLLLISGAMKVYIPPVGTYFGLMLISLGLKKNLNVLAKSQENVYEGRNEIDRMLLFNGLFYACIGIFMILIYQIVYIFPVEFLDDEELYAIRLNIWNAIYIIIGILEIALGFIVASHFLALKRVRGWKVFLWITTGMMVVVFPIGPHVSGIYFRALLKKKRS